MSYANYGISNVQNSISYSMNSDSYYIYIRNETYTIRSEFIIPLAMSQIEHIFLLCLLLQRWKQSNDFDLTFLSFL